MSKRLFAGSTDAWKFVEGHLNAFSPRMPVSVRVLEKWDTHVTGTPSSRLHFMGIECMLILNISRSPVSSAISTLWISKDHRWIVSLMTTLTPDWSLWRARWERFMTHTSSGDHGLHLIRIWQTFALEVRLVKSLASGGTHWGMSRPLPGKCQSPSLQTLGKLPRLEVCTWLFRPVVVVVHGYKWNTTFHYFPKAYALSIPMKQHQCTLLITAKNMHPKSSELGHRDQRRRYLSHPCGMSQDCEKLHGDVWRSPVLQLV